MATPRCFECGCIITSIEFDFGQDMYLLDDPTPFGRTRSRSVNVPCRHEAAAIFDFTA